MTAKIVIVGYKPKEGKAEALKELTRRHHSTLRNENLVTDRLPIIMVAKDGTIIEVFEWVSKSAMEKAHTNPVVLQMWQEYSSVCDYIPVGKLEEAMNLFSAFEPFE